MFFQTVNSSLALVLCCLTAIPFAMTASTAQSYTHAEAHLSFTQTSNTIASVKFVFEQKDDSTLVSIEYSGLAQKAKFPYHIHKNSISGKDCSSAEGHWNPTASTWVGKCNPHSPGRCESGDLSGKHGDLVGHGSSPNPKLISYMDRSLKWTPSPRGFLYKSIVIHSQQLKNGKPMRIACANILPHHKK